MDKLSLQNPVFATYVIAATIMVLKGVSMSWLTVARMMQTNAGSAQPGGPQEDPLEPQSATRSSSSRTRRWSVSAGSR